MPTRSARSWTPSSARPEAPPSRPEGMRPDRRQSPALRPTPGSVATLLSLRARGPRMFDLDERSSGVLLHLTSLPGPSGNGDLGSEAWRFADELAACGQRYWQMLPVGPTGEGNSPYSARSAFAGSPLLV